MHPFPKPPLLCGFLPRLWCLFTAAEWSGPGELCKAGKLVATQTLLPLHASSAAEPEAAPSSSPPAVESHRVSVAKVSLGSMVVSSLDADECKEAFQGKLFPSWEYMTSLYAALVRWSQGMLLSGAAGRLFYRLSHRHLHAPHASKAPNELSDGEDANDLVRRLQLYISQLDTGKIQTTDGEDKALGNLARQLRCRDFPTWNLKWNIYLVCGPKQRCSKALDTFFFPYQLARSGVSKQCGRQKTSVS